jgi:hypothetical protein
MKPLGSSESTPVGEPQWSPREPPKQGAAPWGTSSPGLSRERATETATPSVAEVRAGAGTDTKPLGSSEGSPVGEPQSSPREPSKQGGAAWGTASAGLSTEKAAEAATPAAAGAGWDTKPPGASESTPAGERQSPAGPSRQGAVPAATAVRRAPDEQASDQARTGAIRSASITTEAGNINPASAAAPASGLMPAAARTNAPEASTPPAAPPPGVPREQPREPALRELSLAISSKPSDGQQAEQVSLRVVERGGEVRVSVRTPDTELAGTLRDQLGELVSGLADRGFRADTWQPLAGTADGAAIRAGSAAPGSRTGQDLNGDPGRGFRGEGNPAGQQQQQQRRGPDREELSWLQALTRSSARGGSSNYDYTD